MYILQAIILGIIEGITEFLPVSSTGHLILSQQLIGFNDYKDVFTVVIQVGAIAAVLWFYRRDLLAKTRGFFVRDAESLRFWKLLAIGTAPALAVGYVLESNMDSIATPFIIAMTLIVGGVILWLVDHKRPPVDSLLEPNIAGITKKQAVWVGLGQCFALVPGVSRSGSTIVGGLLGGIDRATATAFSFYLSIPVLILASGYKLLKYDGAITRIDGGATAIVIGLVVSFFTALLAISWLLRYVSRHNFTLFAYYRIALGGVILLLLATGVMT